MTLKSALRVLFVGTIVLFVTVFAGRAEARGGGRGSGDGFSRSSAASGGSFSSRVDAPRPAQPPRESRRENLQQRRGDNREEWQDVVDDDYYSSDWDDHWHSDDDVAGAYLAGATTGSSQPAYVTTLPCSGASVVVNDDVYYECGTTWYRRGFQAGSIVYIVSNPPPGD